MKLLRTEPVAREPSPAELIRIFQSETAEIREDTSDRRPRRAVKMLAALFISLIIVTIFFPVDRVVESVTGQIVTTDPTIVIQPLDPSIIASISVREGDRVKAGQVLATLDPTLTAADVESLRLQIDSLDAEIARCTAELAGAPFTYVPQDAVHGEYYANQQKTYYDERKAQYKSQIMSFDEQTAQAKATIERLTNDQTRYGDRAKLAAEIEGMRDAMMQKQIESRLTLLLATDQKVEMLRNLEMDRNSIVESQHQLQASIANRDAFVQQWQAQTSEELFTARNQRDAAAGLLEKASKHEDLVRLVASDDAIVLRVAKLSVGSVLQAGESFIELAKLNSPVEAEIYVDPRDVGFIRRGDRTILKLDPYNFVEHGWASGTLRWVSEGTFSIPQEGAGGVAVAAGTSPGGSGANPNMPLSTGYYKARVAIEKLELKNVPDDFRILPGTTLTADIHVGTRSLFWYLARGIIRGVDEAMREP